MVFEPGLLGPARPRRTLTTAMPDGASKTVMFAKRYKHCHFSWQDEGTFCAWAFGNAGPFASLPFARPGFGIPNDPNSTMWGLEDMTGPRYSFGNLALQRQHRPQQ
jgi:hypothetical protein